ncbi:MAG: cryptochrome/photolyase family protein, partial [Pseudomonadota bacterium]
VAVDRAEGPDGLGAALRRRANRAEIGRVTAAEPGDAAMRFALERLAGRFRKPVGILDDRRFLCTRDEFAAMREAAGSPAGVYRILRRREGLLMDGEKPEGGSWRIVEGGPRAEAKAPRAGDEGPAAPTVERAASDLESFVETTLPGLGPCEDLDPASPHPFPCPEVEAALDAGLLNPLDVCRRIERAYREGRAPLAAAEHAIYRLVGLREYRRGLMRLGEIAG